MARGDSIMTSRIINTDDFITQSELERITDLVNTNEGFKMFKRAYAIKKDDSFYDMCRKATEAIKYRRKVQKACTAYTKTHGSHAHFAKDGIYDCHECRVKENAIFKISMYLERLARPVFIYARRKEFARANPTWDAKKRKQEAQKEWEEFITKNSY